MVDDPFLSNDSDFTVPVASNTNKLLEAEYLENLKKYGVINLELREADEEINDLSNAVKALRNELDCNQIFANIRKNELETENSLLKMSRRERSKISEMMLGLDRQMNVVLEKQAYIKTFIDQTQMKIDDKKQEMSQNEKDLSDWQAEVQTKEEEEFIYSNYANLDQSKIKDLLIQVSQLNDVCMERKKKLDKENTEICALKFSLSKTIEEANRHHIERMEHIERLQKLVELIASKEVNIDLLFKTIRNLKQETKEKVEFRKEKETLLSSSMADNQELTKRVFNIGNYKIRLKADLREMNLKLTALKNEYRGLRITLDRTVVDLEMSRSTVNRLKRNILEIVERLKHAACEVYNLVTERGNVEREMEAKLERGKKILKMIRDDEGMRLRAEAELKELTKVHSI
ncbi:hypothetical protein HELRODRAFT_177799 [Helobdella robusta]|uniref:Coiled-coil domain-containing protein 39 n=1 Tax=Helobdella robusta TaxID=6412 RepID=T1FCA3_HELRO|nr:hypothetical protein HELRODRAFT_177799 [Helobdella robusta]ESN97739.1 hypothetical protein HELRODRAFT_177799 [Helobdella robusta]